MDMHILLFIINEYNEFQISSRIYRKSQKYFWKILIPDITTWPIVNVATFKFVHIYAQPLVLSIISVIWSAYLSAVLNKKHIY